MDEYISREPFKNKILISSEYLDEDTLMTVINILDCEPTIDAVPVVRCKDCKHHHDCGIHFCDALGMDCPDDSEFFCSYGERKEGAD